MVKMSASTDPTRWHRIDATEVWHLYAGAPLELRIVPEGGVARTVVLGPDLRAGQRPQALVPPRAWQRARSRGAYSLAGTTVCPAFDEEAFELAPPGWEPPGIFDLPPLISGQPSTLAGSGAAAS